MPVPQLNQVQGSGQLPILQTSTFRVLPSELVLEIFSHLDIITVFRFLDTCRYHRYLLINMPDIWRKVRFVPLSEYSAMSSSTSSTPLSIAAAAPIANSNELVAHSASASSSNPPVRLYQKRAQRTLQPRDSSSRSGSDSEGSNESTSKVAESAANRIKHGENERDRDRGGSQSLISEIYAVLRRFRKENQLVNYVREIYMDSTDSPHFPSPLVMLIKFPHLQVLSSRYRRKQTSLTTDAHILKDMLRNGDIMPHSLELRRWDIFHPFMTKEDVTGFKQVLDAIAAIGEGMPGQEKFKNQDGETTLTTAHRVEDSPGRSSPVAPTGVLLDIRLCPGPLSVSSDDISPVAAGDGGAEPQAPSTTGFGGAFHWAVPSSAPTIPSTSSQSTAVLPGPPQPCGNIVWVLEKCRSARDPNSILLE
ncbi:hypothetical protein BGX27_000582 [Mortierella sp. AM989]|nr:hypothetical protein BGX27_000582 [Mortierella sp. AM989]